MGYLMQHIPISMELGVNPSRSTGATRGGGALIALVLLEGGWRVLPRGSVVASKL